jgi:hypothetical protein
MSCGTSETLIKIISELIECDLKHNAMTSRRKFIKQVAAAGVASSFPGILLSQQKPPADKIWACLLHISVNMWKEHLPGLQLSESLWNDALKKMVDSGLNMVVMDLGDAIKYDSHPEIAVDNAWSTSKLSDELGKIRRMGLEPVPKLNFSTCHDSWLGVYERMVSTQKYYEVCSDLIEEVIYLFGKPRFFHIGMDEENEPNQRDYDMVVIRQNQLYWGDFYFLIGEVEKGGCRPWVWQDYIRYHPDEFAKMMPKSVLQSNWYNQTDFDKPATNKSVKAYLDLEKLGYDQVPGGSNYYKNTEKCFFNNVRFCTENVADQRLLGFIQSPWKHTIEENRAHILQSIELAGEAKIWYEKNRKKS